MRQYHENNRQAWNEASEHYLKDLDNQISFLKSGKINFCSPEMKFLENLKKGCQRVIHLQCAGGTDTLSFINLGISEVIGVDISEEMIRVASQKSEKLGMNAKWVVSDILDVPANLNSTADLVYTGRGALNWMMDIEGWARVVSRLLRPQGHFYLFEGHPMTYAFDMHSAEMTPDPLYQGYFSKGVYQTHNWPETYVGKLKDNETDQAVKYEKPWPVSSVINALIDAGLSLVCFEEHPDAFWNEFPKMPKEIREKFPNTYSVLMRKV